MHTIQSGVSVPAGCFLLRWMVELIQDHGAAQKGVTDRPGRVPTQDQEQTISLRQESGYQQRGPFGVAGEERRTSIRSCRCVLVRPAELQLGITDMALSQAACVAPLRPRGTSPCATLRLSRYAGTLLFPCWSCEAWSHAVRRVRLDAKRPVRGLGFPQPTFREYPKGYSRNIAGLR